MTDFPCEGSPSAAHHTRKIGVLDKTTLAGAFIADIEALAARIEKLETLTAGVTIVGSVPAAGHPTLKCRICGKSDANPRYVDKTVCVACWNACDGAPPPDPLREPSHLDVQSFVEDYLNAVGPDSEIVNSGASVAISAFLSRRRAAR